MWKNEEVLEIKDLPQSSVGAPMPIVLSNEHDLFVAYYLENTPPGWDGTSVEVMTTESKDEPVAIVKFSSFCVYQFGPPNDEAFHGHPLHKKGLEPYGIYEVKNSKWIEYFEKMNSVHERHEKERFSRLKHFIFSFHDRTLEVIANSYEFSKIQGSLQDAVSIITPQLYS